MRARGDFRHHPAKGGMLGNLAEDDIGENLAWARHSTAHHCGGGFVAACLQSKYGQAGQAVQPLC